MTEIYLHIVARMADYIATHPYGWPSGESASSSGSAGVAGGGGMPELVPYSKE